MTSLKNKKIKKRETSGYRFKTEKSKKKKNVFALKYLHMNIMETNYVQKKPQNKQHIIQNVNM